MTLQPSSSSTGDTEYVPKGTAIEESRESVDSQSEDSLHGNSPQLSPIKEVNLNDKIPTPPHSSTHTSIDIIITPCPPHLTIPVSTPIFIDSTIAPTISIQPFVCVNVPDMGAEPSSLSTHLSPPISHIIHDEPHMVLRDEKDEDIEGFTYSPSKLGMRRMMWNT
ncbi:unnamed protein product [Lactuca saligna]|uniref:Uncharacterized protein n=1 Tax=Lactuca saligna TaxID=75948 RepID=A0AA36A194_LACSI|nr:unnamed protein product [Lactuca saligna]